MAEIARTARLLCRGPGGYAARTSLLRLGSGRAPAKAGHMSLPKSPIIAIPARLGATRLPGKPLADIHGEPMIVHVWRRAVEADIGPVVVACDPKG